MNNRLTAATILVTALLVSLLLARVSSSQSLAPEHWKGEFRAYFMVGGSTVDIDEFNNRLESRGYPEHSDDFLSLGGGAHVIVRQIVLGAEGHALLVENEDVSIPAGTFKTSLSGFYGFFDLGYLVYEHRGLHLYPLVGLGGGSLNFKIGNAVFNEVLDNPRGSAKLSSIAFLINLAAGADYFVKLGESEKGEDGLVVGLRVGYTFAPAEGDWQSEGIQVSGGPEVGLTGPYIRLMIGGGVLRK